ncbi:CPBP family intramembrane glutamic endopeptidase [Labilibaculum antarcticum]|uniref:CPBP family intramembrane metalloprotease domain-containing protein n=1 Tax=Labilibaculum antarcticum TaxID=1717717 RepID=A0A1Y1CHT0_9BACT|nr:CPBP family intramembrane glutamic endopeptidase [Labilibaculum antarcticum]BAX79939.1 CPBP family intramembrane metalloprotease domain-containing protein [Labilibaculum antarcticum]
MLKGSLSHYSPLSQLMMSLLVVVGSFMLCMFAGSVLAYLIFDVNIFTDATSLDINGDSVNLSVLKFYQVIYSTGMFIIPPFIIAYFVHNKILSYLFLDKKSSASQYIFAILIIVVALPAINLLADINSHLQLPEFLSGVEEWMRNSEDQAEIITKKFLVMETPFDLLVNLILIAVIPALGEELLFRGVIQRIFSNMTKNVHWGIIITAFLFAALHMQFFGLLPRMAMGILFGYLLVWTKSLWVPILAHLINNGMAVCMSYFIYKGKLPEDIENFGGDNTSVWISGFISMILLSILLFSLYGSRERQNE